MGSESIIIFIISLALSIGLAYKYDLDMVYTIDFLLVICISAKIIDSYMFFIVILLLFTKYKKKEVETNE
jgi:hypothetical protein